MNPIACKLMGLCCAPPASLPVSGARAALALVGVSTRLEATPGPDDVDVFVVPGVVVVSVGTETHLVVREEDEEGACVADATRTVTDLLGVVGTRVVLVPTVVDSFPGTPDCEGDAVVAVATCGGVVFS